MKGKYKKIYLIAFLLFISLNIAAIFFVFKKYRKDSYESKTLSGAKFQLSKIKEKMSAIEEKLPYQDSLISEEFTALKLEQAFIDSLLNYNPVNKESMFTIAEKLSKLSTKSEKIEKTIDELAQEINPNEDTK